MNKSEQKAVDRALPLVATQPAMVAATLATLHRATLTARAKRELEALIEQHGLGSHLTKATAGAGDTFFVPTGQSHWPFPRAAASAPPRGLDLADPAPF